MGLVGVQLIRRAFLSYLALDVAACTRPSRDDAAQLELMRRKYPGYRFEFRYEVYLIAENVDGRQLPSDELKEMYRTFFFDSGVKRKTDFVYMNVYERTGRFVTQVAFSGASGRVEASSTREFY